MIGEILSGKYEVLELISVGGMNHIYKGKCLRTGRTITIKMLKPEWEDNSACIEGFKTEAYTTLRLHHKNIVNTTDLGRHNEHRYMVMDFVEGITLRQYMDNCGGRLPVEDCVRIAMQLCNALNYAHHKGVVHKDLKPQNVMMNTSGEPVLIDFGIAEEINTERSESKEVLGSIHYFSPEQARGESGDRRMDIYSLGIMLYEMCTGQLPFTGEDSLQVALKHLHQSPEPPHQLNPEIPQSLSRIILKAIAKEPHERYRSAGEMYRDLVRCLREPDGKYVQMAEERDDRQKSKDVRFNVRAKRIAIFLGVLLGLLAIASVLLTALIPRAQEDKAIYMPYLMDKDMNEAAELLREYDINMTITYEYSLEAPEGRVLRQTPDAGAVLEQGETVEVVVSRNTGEVTRMPELSKLTEEQAVNVLAELGIADIETEIVTDETIADGIVVGYSPAYGEEIDASTKVRLTVNRIITAEVSGMPDLTGTDVATAVVQAYAEGFERVFLMEEDAGALPGRVLAQDPEPSEEEPDQNSIVLHVQSRSGTLYGMIYNFDEELLQRAGTLRVTVATEISGNPVEVILFEGDFADQDDFFQKYGWSMSATVALDSKQSSVLRDVNIYLDDALLQTQKLPLLKEE